MTVMDWGTAALAFAACLCIGLRANLLKPTIKAFVDAPNWIWGSTVALSVAMGCAGIHVIIHGHASPREFVTYAAVSITAGAALVDVLLNGRKATQWAQSSPSSSTSQPPASAL